MKPHYEPSPAHQTGQKVSGREHQTRQLSSEDSSMRQLSSCRSPRVVALATDREKRVASREACWEITSPTVDEVLDLILRRSEVRGTRRRRDHGGDAWGWWQARGAAPTTLVCRRLFAKSSAHRVERVYHGNHSEWNE